MPSASARRERVAGGTFARFAWGLLLVFVILYFARPQDTYGFAFPGLLKIVALPMCGCWVLAIVVEGCWPPLHVRQVRWLLGLLALMAFSTVFALVFRYAILSTIYVGQHIVLPVIVAATLVSTRERFYTLMHWFAGAVALLAVEGVRIYVLPGGRRWAGGISGHFVGGPNEFALFVAMFLPLLVFMALTRKTVRWRRVWWVLSACALAGAVFTFSRGAFLALAGMGCYMLYRSSGHRGGLAAMAVGVLLVLYLALPASYWENLQGVGPHRTRSGKVEFADGSAQGRYEAWQAAVLMAKDRPLTGVGPGNSWAAMWETYRPEGVKRARPAHSMYFDMLGDLGIPGVLWLVGLGVLNVRTARAVQRKAAQDGDRDAALLGQALELSVVGLMVGGAFLSVAFHPQLYWLAFFIGALGDVGIAAPAAAPVPVPVRPRYGLVRT